jgi:hypothetical protein
MSAPHDILVPISVGELLDKITILEIKSERIKNSGQIENIARELGALRAVRLGDDIDEEKSYKSFDREGPEQSP